ncbi:MAG: AAA family ATPase [Lachnospiraceae bacterium]|nr:AAA family ATPase [Lachnospiraceae bacterium]
MKLPVGIQSFEKIRTQDFIYVDKTAYIYQLVRDSVPYFLSRPRRFGKSLLLSTMKAYWEGRKELFSGLDIERLEEGNAEAWKPHPVFYFDFNGSNYQIESGLSDILDEHLRRWEKEYPVSEVGQSLGERFRNLIIAAQKKTGLRSVVLVDEYDKPLLDVIDNERMREHNKEIFKGFFSTLKSFDEYIQFVFITGVSKFHKVSIFSDLNQLNDISLDEDYALMCGITEEELKTYFEEEIENVSKRRSLTVEECLAVLKQKYDGYHFYPGIKGVYNPYSVLKALLSKDFGSYWFETGTPAFLLKKLKDRDFDLRKFTDMTLYASEGMLKDYTGEGEDPVPLLYQTGYLTIADYDDTGREYTLSFPNEEVKYGFYESLLPAYAPAGTGGTGADIFTLDEYVENGNTEGIRNVLTVPTLR